MAGTRLAIHATFMVELFVVVLASFLYASSRRHNPFSSAEPFLTEKSGWKVLLEDVSPAPSPEYDDDSGNIFEYVGQCAVAIMSQIYLMMGVELETTELVVPNRPRRSSLFVQELRQNIANFPAVDGGNEDDDERKASSTIETIILPPLKANLSVPQVGPSSAMGKSLAEALERGFRSQSSALPQASPAIRVGTTESKYDSRFDISDKDLCDNFQLPPQSKQSGNHREVKFPEIILLMGCSSSSVGIEVDRNSDIVVVRTVLTVERKNELQRHLEEDTSRLLLSTLFVPLSNNGHRLESISIKLIDENPASHATEGVNDGDDNGITAKVHFDIIGKALSSSVQAKIGPLLEDLSFIYGGKIEVYGNASGMTEGSVVKTENAVSLAVHSTAYLPLSEDIVELGKDDETTSGKHVSSKGLADWIHTHSHQPTKNTGDVEWILFVPSQDNAPLTVRNKSNGGKGKSIILSSPQPDGGRMKNVYPNGMSIVDIPNFTGKVDLDLSQILSSYTVDISHSLVYLIGYIRAMHGLPPSTGADLSSVKYHGDGREKLSFWELESIARKLYASSLETALFETDALMALLHQHAGTLALPTEVAHELNNATHLLRQSISLIEKGFPVVYATSLLHGSLQHLESVKNDHRFFELPYFAPDHYLAVFSPLVLPLLLPMIVGLVREVKRFRELRNKVDSC